MIVNRNFLLIFTFISSSLAKDIIGTSMIEVSNVLPKKVITLGVQYSSENYTNEYNNQGKSISVAELMNRSFSYNDILQQEIDSQERTMTKAALEAYGISNLDSLAGDHSGNLAINTQVSSVILGLGLSDKFSLFAIQPILKMEIDFKNNFNNSQSFNNLINNLEDAGNYQQVDKINKKLENPITSQLNSYGYEPLYQKKVQALGDLRLMGRYNYLKDDQWTHTLSTTLVLPTGKENSTDQFIDLYIGDGQYDIEIASINEYKFNDFYSQLFSSSFTYQFEKKSALRIPRNNNDILTPDIDQNTRQKYGDFFRFVTQSNFIIKRDFMLSLAYSFYYKSADKISGLKFNSNRYNILQEKTEQNLQDFTLGISFNSIKLFLEKKFLIPLNISLSYSKTFAGKNALKSEYVSLNLMGFYR